MKDKKIIIAAIGIALIAVLVVNQITLPVESGEIGVESEQTSALGENLITYAGPDSLAAANIVMADDWRTDAAYLTLSKYYAAPYDTVSVTGHNFGVEESVSVRLFGEIRTIMTDAGGNFTASFVVPISVKGTTVEVRAEGAESGIHRTVNIVIAGYYPHVSPSTYFVPRGGHVSFTGTGFAPNEQVGIYNNGSSLGTVKANGSGQFTTGSLMVPYTSAVQPFRFVGEASGATYTVTVSIASYNPWILLSNYYAGDNASLSIHGFGFGSGESVEFLFAGTVLGTATSNAAGEVHFSTSVPEGGSGQKTVRAVGQSTHADATTVFTQAF